MGLAFYKFHNSLMVLQIRLNVSFVGRDRCDTGDSAGRDPVKASLEGDHDFEWTAIFTHVTAWPIEVTETVLNWVTVTVLAEAVTVCVLGAYLEEQ